MKLSLNIRSHVRGFFYPGDTVQGLLTIRNAKSPPKVTICLAGQINTQVPVQGLGANPGTQKETIFQLKQNVDAEALTCAVGDDGRPIYTCAIEVQLPSDACPNKPSAAGQLPSSLSIAASDFSVRVEYFVSVTVTRYIFGGVPTCTTARRALQVVSNPTVPADSPPDNTVSHEDDEMSKISLPLYSRNESKTRTHVQLKLILPLSSVLVRGEACPIELLAQATTDKALIQSIVINLLQTVSVRLGSTTRKAVQCLHSISITGAINVGKEGFAMHLGSSGILSLSNAYPSCDSEGLAITHSVEAKVIVSRANHPGLQTLELRSDVIVMDPPPVYECDVRM